MNAHDQRRIKRLCLAMILPALVATAAASPDAERVSSSTETSETITAGIYVSPPFVTREEEGYGGMAIDLWESIVAESGITSEYKEYASLAELVEAVGAGEADIAVTNLTVTEDRAEILEFTHPWFDAGLQIMVSQQPRTGFPSLLAGLADTGHLRIFALILIAVIVGTGLLTFFDRRFDPNFPKRWRDGLAESFYTVMSVATTGKPPSRTKLFGWIGRLWAGLWLICGVAVVAYVTASITSVMTTVALTGNISGLSDLAGKNVGVLRGSTADEFSSRTGLRTTAFDGIDEAIEALGAGRIDAIVGDAPVLDYFAHTRPDHDVAVVGELFEPEKYAFGFARDSELRRPLTIELIGADEEGVIEEIRTQYFGPRH